jgi:hypothetical protein
MVSAPTSNALGRGRRIDRETVIKKAPFRIDEKGWGEFDMTIVLTGVGKGGDHTLEHDLNFQSERYEAKHQVVSSEDSRFPRLPHAMLINISDLQKPQARAPRPPRRVRRRRSERYPHQGRRQEEEPERQER